MAIQQQELHHSGPFLLDALYCEELERWEEDIEVEEGLQEENGDDSNRVNPSVLPLFLLEQDLFWDDEELFSLFAKEQQQKQETHLSYDIMKADSSLSVARREAVEWMLRVNARHGFSAFTAVLAVNYLDRFLSSFIFQKDKPWMIQLSAVTCLSLAAKVEETRVPLLLDFQVEETKYVFEAKMIQRMELLVLSTLQWKMHPVTPLSFLDHIVRRLGLKNQNQWEFLRRCERLLLSIAADSRFVRYVPSVMAAATMMHAIDLVEPQNPAEYQSQLLGVLKISQVEVNECYEFIMELTVSCFHCRNTTPQKRMYGENLRSPSGVIEACFSCDSSNDSWGVGGPSMSSSPEPLLKKSRTNEVNRVSVSVNVGATPR